jgi:cold shock CspA family protein
MYEGTIVSVKLDRKFGFVSSPSFADDIFFFESAVDDDLDWDERLTQRRVRFNIEQSARGLRAVNVQASD